MKTLEALGHINILRKPSSLALTFLGFAAFVGCTATDSPEPTTVTVETTQSTATVPGTVGILFTFDSIGSNPAKGGSNVIQVYTGPYSTAKDKQPVGTYMSGQSATADCSVSDGRELSSDPGADEEPRTYTAWLHIVSPEAWATVVYVDNPDAVLAKLDDCDLLNQP